MIAYFAAYFPMLQDNIPIREDAMPTTQEIFTSLITNRSNVAKDQDKLAADTAAEVADQAAIDADVMTEGPALVKDGANNPFALLPSVPPGGKTQEIALRDGSVEPAPPPAP